MKILLKISNKTVLSRKRKKKTSPKQWQAISYQKLWE
jgi:hypothetical protein